MLILNEKIEKKKDLHKAFVIGHFLTARKINGKKAKGDCHSDFKRRE